MTSHVLDRSTDSGRATDNVRCVALMTPDWPPERCANGIISYVGMIRPAMVEAGARTFVLVRGWGKRDTDSQVIRLQSAAPQAGPARRLMRRAVDLVAPQYGQAWSQTRAIVWLLHRLARQADLQLVEMEETNGLARWVAPQSPVPVVVRLHGPWFLTGPANEVTENAAFRRRVRLEGMGIARADAVTAPSQDVIDRVRRHYGLALPQARVIANPVSPVPAAQQWRLDAAEPRHILFVGRFDRIKGGDLMIDAFARLLKQMPDCRLTFVGPDRGLADDEGRRWNIEPFIAHCLPDAAQRQRVQWLGFQPADRIRQLRCTTHVTVVCSRYENFSNTCLEALAAGSPLIASRTGGSPEIVADGRNGMLCEAGSGEDLAAKLHQLLNDPSLCQRLGRQAVEDVRRRFDPKVIAQQTMEFYDEVVAQRRAVASGAEPGDR